MRIVIDHDGTTETLAAIDRAVAIVVTNGTVDIAANAIERAPRVTGYLAGSILPDTTQAASAEHTGVVTVGAEYGGYVERGTVHQAAQPFMAPSVAEVEATLPRVAEAVLAAELGRGGA